MPPPHSRYGPPPPAGEQREVRMGTAEAAAAASHMLGGIVWLCTWDGRGEAGVRATVTAGSGAAHERRRRKRRH